MRIILSIFILAACLHSIFADDEKVGKYNLGFAAGFTTGYGLSYREWFNNDYGFQVTCGPYYDKSFSETDASLSLGAAGFKMIHAASKVNLFGYYGTHVHYSYSKLNYDIYLNSAPTVTKDWNLFTGGGIGLDFHFWLISFSLMSGVMYENDFNGNFHFGITGETALYYSF